MTLSRRFARSRAILLELRSWMAITPVRRLLSSNPSKDDPMSDTPPDRLAINPASPYHDAEILERGVGIVFNGAEKTNVDEYCVSEGWIRVTAGKAVDRKGNPMTIKLQGKVEPYFRNDNAEG